MPGKSDGQTAGKGSSMEDSSVLLRVLTEEQNHKSSLEMKEFSLIPKENWAKNTYF